MLGIRESAVIHQSVLYLTMLHQQVLSENDFSGLQSGYYVCVGVLGSSATTTSSKTTTNGPPKTTTDPHSPHQSGIVANCMYLCSSICQLPWFVSKLTEKLRQ